MRLGQNEHERQQTASFTNFPGGVRAALDFIIIRWFGLRGSVAFG